MLLNELFSNIDTNKVSETLDQYHIQVPDNYQFSNINIVIGQNGSGKTRFLNAIKELYVMSQKRDILYGYFPALSDCKVSKDESGAELPDCTLYESMYLENVSFSDFFKEIEQHNEEFIPELLIYHSQRQKERGEKALKIVFDSFRILTGKELVNQDGQLSIKQSDERQEALSDALASLSPGELMLFYMSIFLAIQQNGKKNKVIILDEPESHLHPKALLSFIKLLTQADEFQEIWIATHSLFIVPEFQFENITYIANSSIQRRTSMTYQNIFSGVLGDEEGKVRTFFSSLAQWQYCEFIAECFTNPTVIDTVNPQDEQVRLFINCIKRNKIYRILDCGGGSGRLGLSLKAAQLDEMKDIRYDIYDKEPAYTGTKFKVYTDLKKIKGPYDCVVMMNFLHEVEPKEWVRLFREIYMLMKDRGHLVFVEVTALSQGEMPNQSGYFILGKEELEILFRCNHHLEEIRHKEKQKSVCVLVPRERLTEVNDDSVKSAIRHLKGHMLRELEDIRRKETIEKADGIGAINARYFAFLTQQYMNAKLFFGMSDAVEDKTEMLPQKRLKRTIRQQERLDKALKIMDMLKTAPELLISGYAWDLFSGAVNIFQEYGAVSEQKRTECWKCILEMEKTHEEKGSIALLLTVLVLMGDSRGYNRIRNNGYNRYLPKEFLDFRV